MPAQPTTPSSRPGPAFVSQTHRPAQHPQRCEYTSKRCENARALKPNGERHRLCDYHRRLANDNQRRWQNRKKMQQQRAETTQATALLELRHTPATPDHTSDLYWASHEAGSTTGDRGAAWPVGFSSMDTHMDPVVPALDPLARPRNDQPCVLPRLRQHHVLSHALSLPAERDESSPHNALEFGGVRAWNQSNGPPSFRELEPRQQFEYDRSSSAPGYFGAWQSRENDANNAHAAPHFEAYRDS